MKLSFWTLGMPWTDNTELAKQAAAMGFHGVDLRATRPDENGKPENLGNVCITSTDDEIAETVQAFADAGVAIASLHCYPPKGYAEMEWSAVAEDVAAHAQLAVRVDTPRIRVVVSHPKEGVTWDEHLNNLGSSVIAGLDQAPGIGAIFENHPGTANAEQLFQMCERLGDARLGVELSPDHSFVMQEDTVGLIDRYAPHVHQLCYADRKIVQEDFARFDGRYYYVQFESCGPGEGDVPAAAVFAKLKEKGFDQYVTLKWEKTDRFGQHLIPGEEVLPKFVEFMKQFDVID